VLCRPSLSVIDTYHLLNVAELVVRRDCDRLNEELVSASRIWWWVLFHCLQQHLHFHILLGVNPAGIWSHAVSNDGSVEAHGSRQLLGILFWGSRLDLEE